MVVGADDRGDGAAVPPLVGGACPAVRAGEPVGAPVGVVRRFVPSLGESGPEADEAWQRHGGDEAVAALTERSRVEVRVFFDELHRADDREFVEVASGAIGEDAAMQRFPRIAQVTGAKVDLAWLLARDRGVAAGHAADCPAVTVLYQRAWNRAARQSGHGGIVKDLPACSCGAVSA